MKTTVEEMHEESDKRVGEVFRTMLIFTFFMILAPISTYFWTKGYVFESNCLFIFKDTINKQSILFYYLILQKGFLMLSSDQSYIYAAISAILVVHVILAAFIYIAWQDATSDSIKKKKQ